MPTEAVPTATRNSFAPDIDFLDDGAWNIEPWERKPIPGYPERLMGTQDSDWATGWMMEVVQEPDGSAKDRRQANLPWRTLDSGCSAEGMKHGCECEDRAACSFRNQGKVESCCLSCAGAGGCQGHQWESPLQHLYGSTTDVGFPGVSPASSLFGQIRVGPAIDLAGGNPRGRSKGSGVWLEGAAQGALRKKVGTDGPLGVIAFLERVLQSDAPPNSRPPTDQQLCEAKRLALRLIDILHAAIDSSDVVVPQIVDWDLIWIAGQPVDGVALMNRILSGETRVHEDEARLHPQASWLSQASDWMGLARHLQAPPLCDKAIVDWRGNVSCAETLRCMKHFLKWSGDGVDYGNCDVGLRGQNPKEPAPPICVCFHYHMSLLLIVGLAVLLWWFGRSPGLIRVIISTVGRLATRLSGYVPAF